MKEICDVIVNVPKDSTPLVEGFHVVILHLITTQLATLIDEASVSK